MPVQHLHWSKALELRDKEKRHLRVPLKGVDFVSNDYLGMARNEQFAQRLCGIALKRPNMLLGATGSRLISGNSIAITDAEDRISEWHGVESSLLFPSGYKANLALFSCIASRGDNILVDACIHRSVHDGCALSLATKWKFRHNDLDHLEDLLKKVKGQAFIAVESLYSMDGDYAPLEDIMALAQRYGAYVIVDEAHAIGVFGLGLVHKKGLQDQVLATLVTYGKAFGLQGAAWLGGRLLKDFLVNFASPFIYSTGMSDMQACSIQEAYLFLKNNAHLRDQLQTNISYFRKAEVHTISMEDSPIQVVQFSRETMLERVLVESKARGLDLYPIYAPTVPKGSERLRVCIHAFNQLHEIHNLLQVIKKYKNEF